MPPESLRTQVKRFTMCGDVGDPIYCKDYLDIYRYIKSVNPDIHVFTITNGSGRSQAWWEQFASIANDRDSINFSIDGFDHASNNLYRIGSRWDSIMTGISTLRSCNNQIFVNWAVIVFKFNQDHLSRIEHQARLLGCDGLQITKSTKFGSKYGEAYQGLADTLEPDSQWVSQSHRYERSLINLSGRTQPTQDYLDHNRNRWDLVKEKYRNHPVIPLCEIGNRGIYVNAEGVVFPCSWLSFPYKTLSYDNKVIEWQNSFFSKYRSRMNLNNRTLHEILHDPLWQKCSRGWRDKSKTWVECAQKCNHSVVSENYAVGWETN